MIGQTISHYKILEKLGEGGMGVVYKAEDIRLGRIVALKFPPSDRLEDAEDVERFNREARAVSALNDPHIATIHELDEVDGRKFIVLEYIPGGTLKSFAKKVHESGRNLSIEQVLDFAAQMVEGLAHAHENGVIHRDLKPDNLLLTDKGQVKITDFGLAKLKGSPELTRSGSTLGTVSYMSPEQVRGEELDTRSDLFSVGVILYQLAAGQLPFRGEHEMAIGYSILNEEPIPLKTLRPDLPDALINLVERCLEKDKERRIGNASELSVSLKGLLPTLALHKKTARRRSRRVKWAALGTIAAMIITTIAVIQLVPRRYSASGDGPIWIAVLPFENLSADPENEYFSDGITEDIITQLSKIADLSVVSRTSTMRYKGTDKSLRKIGEELGVDAILEGSVRLADEEVRITSQLIDAPSDKYLWAETYDRELKDIFKIQSDVAESIARALEVRLTRAERGRITSEPTQDMEAYDTYLRGREFYHRYRKPDNEDAIVMFKMALELDPNYALAYAGLADAYAQRVARFNLPVAWLDSAFVAARRAIALNPELAEGYKALGLVYETKGRYSEALQATKKALEYNPSFQDAVANVGYNLLFNGRPDDAIIWLKKAERLDGPGGGGRATQLGGLGLAYLILDDMVTARSYIDKAARISPSESVVAVATTWLYMMEQRYDDLRSALQHLLMISPRVPFLHHWLGVVEIMEGNFTEARTHLERAVELHRGSLSSMFVPQDSQVKLAFVLRQLGEVDAADELLHRASDALEREIRNGTENGYQFYLLAETKSIRGDRAEALKWLQRSLDSGFVLVRVVDSDPMLGDLREDPQFKKMVADFKVRIAKMRERVESNDR